MRNDEGTPVADYGPSSQFNGMLGKVFREKEKSRILINTKK